MRIRYALIIFMLLLLSGCSLGPFGKEETASPPPADTPMVAAPVEPPVQPSAESSLQPPPALMPTAPVPLGTPFPGLGRPVAEAFDFDLSSLDPFIRDNYLVAGYHAVDHQGSTYVALHLTPLPQAADDEESEGTAQSLVFYRLRDGQAKFTEAKYFSDMIEVDPGGWRDVNGDASPDLPIHFHNDMDHWQADYWRLFSLNSEGMLSDLLANLNTGVSVPIALQDMDNDALPEVKVVEASWYQWRGLCPDCSPMGYKYYGFYPNKGVYQDISARFLAAYQADIDAYRQRLTESYAQPFDAQTVFGPAVSLLLAYDFSGQRWQGWDEFMILTAPANWSQISLEGQTQLENLRAMLARQFEANQPFSPEETQNAPGQ